MDGYYAKYFADFAPGRPYISLILATIDGQLTISGRIFWRGQWHVIGRTSTCLDRLETWMPRASTRTPQNQERASRFVSAFGDLAYKRLRASSVAVIGAGGTGSAAIEVLARAGVGQIIVVDPDIIENSNLERLHGSAPRHPNAKALKVAVAREHIQSIDSSIDVIAIVGRLPQAEVVDSVVKADILLGCTDKQHSRLALSDIAFRYLVPALDCGVVIEGENGNITGQIAQFVRFLPSDACALCRNMVSPQRLSQELMSDEEKAERLRAAEEALRRGDDPNPYWHADQQINTVGYLTTAVGGMIAGYAIGLLTRTFDPPFSRLQMNFGAPYLDVTNQDERQRSNCACSRFRGWADQASVDALISAPNHWPPVQLLGGTR
jgi:molybdopterin/thiamine biosynthesis adenylyltransferase